jgi:Domain of unknown function (DUF1942)
VNRTTKIKTVAATAAPAVAFASTALTTATSASAWWPFDAQGPNIQKFGTREDLVDGAGTIVQGWTVHNLKPSTDAIPYPVRGRLWEASATDEAIRGNVTPIISNMNARSWRRNVPSDLQRPACQRDQSGAEGQWQALFRRDRRRSQRSGLQQSGSRPIDLGAVRRRGRLP